MRALPRYEDRGRLTSFAFGIASHRIVEQQAAAETARALNTTSGAARVAQHRALNRLRAEFAST